MSEKSKGGRPPENKIPVTFRYNPDSPPYKALLKLCADRGWNFQRALDELVNLWYGGQLAQAASASDPESTAPEEELPSAGAKLLSDEYM